MSRATVGENARRSVARGSAGGTKRWNAKVREGRNRKRAYCWRRDQMPGPVTERCGSVTAGPDWSVASEANGDPQGTVSLRRAARCERGVPFTNTGPTAPRRSVAWRPGLVTEGKSSLDDFNADAIHAD